MAGFPPLTVNIRGYRNTIPASSSVSFQFISAASKAPFSPPPKKKTQPVSLCVSLPLSDGVLLPCIQGLGSLSLPFPPPPLPACDPTLRPHPSSLCQSGAAQPCRGAELPATHWLQAGRQAGRARRRGAAAEPRTKCVGIFLKIACKQHGSTRIHIHPLHPTPPHPPLIFECHAAAAGGSLIAQSSTHVTLMTSASGLIEDTSAGWGGCGRFTVFCVKALQHYV